MTPSRRVRHWYWRSLRRVWDDCCDDCGRPIYGSLNGAPWHSEEALWQQIVGSSRGLLCLRCFIARCHAQKQYVVVLVEANRT